MDLNGFSGASLLSLVADRDCLVTLLAGGAASAGGGAAAAVVLVLGNGLRGLLTLVLFSMPVPVPSSEEGDLDRGFCGESTLFLLAAPSAGEDDGEEALAVAAADKGGDAILNLGSAMTGLLFSFMEDEDADLRKNKHGVIAKNTSLQK